MEAIKLGEHEFPAEEVIKALKDGGLIVRTSEEESTAQKTFLEGLSHEDDRVNHLIGPVTRRERESFEGIVKDLTGLDKIQVDGKLETALEYAKRAVGQTKKDLELKAQEGVKDDELKKKLAQMEKDFADAEKVWKKKEADREKEFKRLGFQSKVDSYISGKTMKEGLDQVLLKSHINSVKNEALSSQFESRSLGGEESLEVLIDTNGSVKYDDKGNPMTLGRFLDSRLSSYYHEDRRVNGNGTNPHNVDPNSKSSFSMNPNIKYKEDLVAELSKPEYGLKQGSEEYQKLYEEHGKDLPLKGV